MAENYYVPLWATSTSDGEYVNLMGQILSGHMYYNFVGNSMSIKNKDAVADLPYSDEGKAYIACNMELDKALEYLITGLEEAGKRDNTVIMLSADHYPYGMKLENYEELARMELEDSLEIYRNTLILWNSQIKEPITIEKLCGAMDLLPTIYNLFGFTYDSRLFAGTDMLSDSQGLVVFADRSFIAEDMSYNKVTGEVTSPTQETLDEEFIQQRKQKVRQLYNYSTGILDLDFFHYVEQAVE